MLFFSSHNLHLLQVLGGNIELVKWMVEKQDCPLSVRRDPKSGMFLSLQTSSSRTLFDLAMTGKPKVEILSYLVQRNLSVVDCKDPKLAPKTLQVLMGAGFSFEKRDGVVESFSFAESCDASITTVEDAVSKRITGLFSSQLQAYRKYGL